MYILSMLIATLPSVVTVCILLQYADDTTLIRSGASSASTAIVMNN